MSAPVGVPSDAPMQLFLKDGVPSLVENIGRNPIYLSSDSDLTTTIYEYVLQPGAVVNWNGNTRMWAITAINAPSSLLIFPDSIFAFSPDKPTFDVDALPYTTLKNIAPNSASYIFSPSGQTIFPVNNAEEIQIKLDMTGLTPAQNNACLLVSWTIQWYNNPDNSDIPFREEFWTWVNAPTVSGGVFDNGVLLGYEPEMWTIITKPKGKYFKIFYTNWNPVSSIDTMHVSITTLSKPTIVNDSLLLSPDQGLNLSLASAHNYQIRSNPNAGMIEIENTSTQAAFTALYMPPMSGLCSIEYIIGSPGGSMTLAAFTMNKDSPYYGRAFFEGIAPAGSVGTFFFSNISFPNAPWILVCVPSAGFPLKAVISRSKMA